MHAGNGEQASNGKFIDTTSYQGDGQSGRSNAFISNATHRERSSSFEQQTQGTGDRQSTASLPPPRSENSFIVRAAHVVESDRPFTEVLDRMIAEQTVEIEKQQQQLPPPSETHMQLDLNRQLIEEDYLPEANEDRAAMDRIATALAPGATGPINRIAGMQTQGVGGPLGAPAMTSTLRENERAVHGTVVETANGVSNRLASNEMARQREALMVEQRRLKEVLAEQELLLQRKQHELRLQQETHKQRLQVGK